jgi:hypothetical protein
MGGADRKAPDNLGGASVAGDDSRGESRGASAVDFERSLEIEADDSESVVADAGRGSV